MQSEEESESIATFCAITNTEPDLAQRFLSLADGQLDNAVALFMEHGAGLVGTGAGGGSSSSSANAGADTGINESTEMDEIIRQHAEDSYRPVIAPRHDTLVGGGPMYSVYDEDVFEDAAFAAAASSSSSSSMSSLPIPLGSHRHASSEGAFSASGASSSAQRDSKANKLARMFATPYEIMFEGSFDAVKNFKYLFNFDTNPNS
ncbi:hypothetical protein HDU80_008082 [Chytriomyces hyalinus]|nr:hypothetical protein HDU80_008082 [Chytriomyces hyalinus]